MHKRQEMEELYRCGRFLILAERRGVEVENSSVPLEQANEDPNVAADDRVFLGFEGVLKA